MEIIRQNVKSDCASRRMILAAKVAGTGGGWRRWPAKARGPAKVAGTGGGLAHVAGKGEGAGGGEGAGQGGRQR